MSEALLWTVVSIVAFCVFVVILCAFCAGLDLFNCCPNVLRGPLCDCWGVCGKKEEPPHDWRDRYMDARQPPQIYVNLKNGSEGGATGDDDAGDEPVAPVAPVAPVPTVPAMYFRADRSLEDVEKAKQKRSNVI